MNRQTVIEKIATKMESSKADAERFLNAHKEVMFEALEAHEEFPLYDTTTLKVAPVKEQPAKPEKVGRNPKTNESITIPAKPAQPATFKVKLKLGKTLKTMFK